MRSSATKRLATWFDYTSITAAAFTVGGWRIAKPATATTLLAAFGAAYFDMADWHMKIRAMTAWFTVPAAAGVYKIAQTLTFESNENLALGLYGQLYFPYSTIAGTATASYAPGELKTGAAWGIGSETNVDNMCLSVGGYATYDAIPS